MLLLTGLVLVVVLGTSGFLLGYQKSAVRQVVSDALEVEAGSISQEIHRFIDENLRDVQAMAANLPQEALAGRDRERLNEYLRLQNTLYPKFENGVFLLDHAGNFLTDYPPHPELTNEGFAFRDYYQRAAAERRAVLSAPYLSKRTGLPVVTAAAPVLSPNGRLLGVLCSSLNLFSPTSFGENWHRMGKNGYFYVVNAEGRILLHPDVSRILTVRPYGANVFLDKALKGFEGAGETLNSKGVRMLIASRRIPDLNWFVLAQVPLDEALSVSDEALRAVSLFSLAVLLVVIPIGVYAIGRISKPLEALEAATQVISQDLRKGNGALARPFASNALAALRRMRSNDEIGKLSRAFFRLSVRLKQTLASLRNAADDWERTFNSVQEALLVLDSGGRILGCNRVAEDLMRSRRNELIGKPWWNVLGGGGDPPQSWPSQDVLRQEGRLKLTSSLPVQPGVFEMTFNPVQGRRGGRGHLLMVTDVTEKTRAEERIRELAFHDALTGLPNRLLLVDRLEQAMATSERNNTRVGVLFLDLDEFKSVNDTHGHETGDVLLRHVAQRLSACLRGNDTLSRYAGDEFISVLIDLRSPAEAAAIATRMLEAMSEAFNANGHSVRVGASIGIAVYPEDGATPNQLINHADSAMYRAKGHGKNSFWFADKSTSGFAEDLPKQ